jgi:predicted Zn finger-like uncharacterized protein
LIVTCEQCATQFQLDDAKVPVGGVRVRCSRCKHAFFIEPPGAELPQSPIDRLAQAALDEHAPPDPGSSDDLLAAEDDGGTDFAEPSDFSGRNEEAQPDDLAPANDLASGSDFATGSDLADENEISDEGEISDESDWEFNEDRSRRAEADAERHEAAPDPARAALDDLLSARPAARAPAAPRGEASFGSAGGLLAAAEDDEDLGSPESWDLLADVAPPGAAAAQAELAPTAEAAAPAPRTLPASVAPVAIEEWIDPAEPSRLLAWVARSGHAIGWGVTLTLFALVAFATLRPGTASEADHGAQRLAQLEARAIAGRWVENAAAGPLFVVSGRLVNPGASPQPLGALAGVRLLDANGARLSMSEPAALGSLIEPEELREATPSALQARQLEAARRLAAIPIAPGQTLEFEAVVTAVPAAAERFVLEPIPQARLATLAEPSTPAGAR